MLKPARVACSSTSRHLGQPAAREDLVHDEFEELQVPHRDWHSARGEFLVTRQNDGVQQHHSVGGQRVVGHLEERVVAIGSEVLERTDRDDSVDRLVELLPAFEQDSLGPGALGLVEQLLDVQRLILAQRQPHHVDVVAAPGRASTWLPNRNRHPATSCPAAGPTCPATDRSWRSVPAPASDPRARSRRSCRSASRPGRADRSRRTGRNGAARCRNAAPCIQLVRRRPVYLTN